MQKVDIHINGTHTHLFADGAQDINLTLGAVREKRLMAFSWSAILDLRSATPY